MKPKYVVRLSEEERTELTELVNKGKAAAQKDQACQRAAKN